jgi:hypothetical protein
MVSDNADSDDESDSDSVTKTKISTEDVEWRERDESKRSNDVNNQDSDEGIFHPPCEHCGSTVFKQEVTTTNYVECDTKGKFVDQETEHERDEIIYCNECGRKLSERTTY